ncbi:MAG: hypothetical protein FWD92_06320 [Methanomassiliicoccaceae archaeon]|nr:hypothetical protein [Methanomassiliicoccaceae archaeon]
MQKRGLYKVNMVIAFIPIVGALMIFPFLPEMIPTRFSGPGDGPFPIWSNKWSVTGLMSSFFLPLMTLFLFKIMYWFAPIAYEAAEGTDKPLDPKHVEFTVLFTVIFMLIVWVWLRSLTLSHI